MVPGTIRRLITLVVTFGVALVVIFVLLRLLPGDPANALLSSTATDEQIAAARAAVGSDQPLLRQFWSWLGDVVRLDLGESFVSHRSVGAELRSRLRVTLPLTFAGFLLAVAIALPVGALAAFHSRRWFGTAISAVSQLGVAIPVFWVGMLLAEFFAVRRGWLPSGGFPRRGWGDFGEAVRSLTLPAITIAVVSSAALVRYVRTVTLDVLGSDYLRTARALGESTWSAFVRHGIRNMAAPVVSVLGIELATTFLGAVVVEQVFTLPGLGSMFTTAIEQHDYPNIQGVLLFSTFAVLVVGFAADVARRAIDPRLRGRR